MSTDYSMATFSDHAVRQLVSRRIGVDEVLAVLADPAREELVRPGRVVLTSPDRNEESGSMNVMRVFVDVGRDVPVVVTAYRSSKIAKYWMPDEDRL